MKLTIFPVSGLENYKYITNTMECSTWRDFESRVRMKWEMKISLLPCLHEYPATRMEALRDRAVSSYCASPDNQCLVHTGTW